MVDQFGARYAVLLIVRITWHVFGEIVSAVDAVKWNNFCKVFPDSKI
jgi:hypothetical protein